MVKRKVERGLGCVDIYIYIYISGQEEGGEGSGVCRYIYKWSRGRWRGVWGV